MSLMAIIIGILTDFSKLFTLILVIIFAAFLRSDCDLFLFFCSNPKSKAFSSKIVWITGASSGIGAALAKALTKSGAQVVVSARRKNQLDDVAMDCATVGKCPLVLPLNITDHKQQAEAYKTIIEKYGKIDIIVLNPGRSQRAAAMDTPIEATEQLMQLNFLSYVALTKLVVPSMVMRKNGQIMVTSSVSGKMGTPGGSSYSATKFALHGYFDALRSEIHQHGVHVGIACPGPVFSELGDHVIRAPGSPAAAVERGKMSSERCAELMTRALFWRVDEFWLAKQPFLLFTYLSSYLPWMFRQVMKRKAGPSRLRAIQSGLDPYDLKAQLRTTTSSQQPIKY